MRETMIVPPIDDHGRWRAGMWARGAGERWVSLPRVGGGVTVAYLSEAWAL